MDTIKASVSTRRLTAYYAVGLLLIGCISIVSYMVQRIALERSLGFAEVINLSGRQRMLSQRIAGMAEQYRLGDLLTKRDLEEAIAQMEQAENTLSRPYVSAAVGPASSKLLHTVYFEGLRPLDGEVHRFLAIAQQVTQVPADDPRLPELLLTLNAAARAPLLKRLDEVVAIHQKESERKLDELARLEWILLGIMILTLGIEVQLIFRPMVEKVGMYSRNLIAISHTDPLTGLPNRRGFEMQFQLELERSKRYRRPLSLLAVDVDFFKQINDTYGHPAGDEVLRALGRCIREAVRPSDVLGRLGGEEFAMLLPESALSNATVLAERLRTEVERMQVVKDHMTMFVTISIGVTELSPDTLGIKEALEAADQMLYRAKLSGRNCVVSHPINEEEVYSS